MKTSFRFGEFELHPERFELCRAGTAVRLERKPMEVLILLTSRQGSVVTRTELAEQLWGSEVFVDTEHGINTAIRKVRQALRDDPDQPCFIQTVPRLGYRFLPPVSSHPEPAPELGTATWGEVSEISGSALPEARSPRLRTTLVVAASLPLVLLAILVSLRHKAAAPSSPPPPEVVYEQLTDLTDSAVAPALSPDGHTLAFIRGDESFASTGAIYVQALPNREERIVSDDERPKYGLTFSPDGSRIAYTVFGTNSFATYAVSVFGGDPALVLNNAAGLSWLSADQVLFSEVKSGIHLGVVTGTVAGGAKREVYFPSHQRGMAHYSYASPDHRWILTVEMDGSGHWAPCHLVALDGGRGTGATSLEPSASRAVGPDGACTAAAWSDDGRWMYFVATVAGQSHLWRQRFPEGLPQQISFGAAEEDGLATDVPRRALITSIGTTQSALWIRDGKGERALSSEGRVLNESSPPVFRDHGAALYYLLQRGGSTGGAELWRADAKTGKVQEVIPGVSMVDYDVSADGKQVVFSTSDPVGGELWVAPTDRSRVPARLGVEGASFPHFGEGGRVLYEYSEGQANYLGQVDQDGRRRRKLLPFAIHEFKGVSPAGRWAMALVSESPESVHPTLVAFPADGSPPKRICANYCAAGWSSNGKYLLLTTEAASAGKAGQSVVLAAGPNEQLPALPPEGFGTFAELRKGAGAKQIPRADLVVDGDLEHYAFVKTTTQRNLYRVTVR